MEHLSEIQPSCDLNVWNSSSPKFLNRSQIEMIDEALSTLSDSGEVHLIVQKGCLRFVVTQNSHDALSWHPGLLESDDD